MGESEKHRQTFSNAGRFGGIYFSCCEFIREDVTAMITRTAVAILNLPHKTIPDYYLPRKDVMQNLQIMIDTWSNHYLPTIVVHGPRGSGKSTAVRIAVNQPNEKRRPVLLARVNTTDVTRGKGDLKGLHSKLLIQRFNSGGHQPNPPVSRFHKELCPPQFSQEH